MVGKRRHVYAVAMRIITEQGWVVGLGSKPHLFQDQTNLVQEALFLMVNGINRKCPPQRLLDVWPLMDVYF